MAVPPARPATRARAPRPKASARRSLGEVGATGDRRATLEALRDLLSASVEQCTLRDRSALSGRLMDVLAQLDGLPVAKESDPVNEIAARAARKRAAAAG